MTANVVMILDLEVENHTFHGDLASPRHPDNYVVCKGQAFNHGPVHGEYYESKEAAAEWLHIPDDVWLLVAHNAPFELAWMLHTQREKIMAYLERGGRIFCTALAEYLLSNQQHTYPALNDVAPDYGGTMKVDAVKLLWEQGLLTSQIDRKLLYDEYLLGPEGDIENTRKVFYGQVAKLQARGMWDMAMLRMEALLSNCFAMDAGLHVDTDKALQHKAQLEARLGELKNTMLEWRQHIPDYVEFKETSDYNMSSWLFGGPIKYRQRDVWYEEDGVTPKYEKGNFYRFEDGTRVSVDCFDPDKESEPGLAAHRFQEAVQQRGPVVKYKAGKNRGLPKVFREDTDTPKEKWYDRVITLGPLCDLQALPKDIRTSFEREFTGKRRHSTDDSPVYSTGSEAIEVLSTRPEFEHVRPLLRALTLFAKLDKDLGTYYLKEELDEEGNVTKQSGMLQYLTPWRTIYHVLNSTATVTTRLSSMRPNGQNFPRGDEDASPDGYTSEVKTIFTSRYDDPVWLRWAAGAGVISAELRDECLQQIEAGEQVGAILGCDYKALEVVVLAAFSKDPRLVKALLDGTDMHTLRLSAKLNRPYDELVAIRKDKSHPEHRAIDEARTHIKPPSFAYQYGATAAGIAFSTGMPLEEAEQFVENEKALFPGVEEYFDGVRDTVERSRTLHREEAAPGQWRVYGRGTWVSPAGTTMEFREYPKVEWIDGRRSERMEFKSTQMRNYPIQGEAGFFVQGMAGQVIRWLIANRFFGGKVAYINQVHDALYFDCHRSIVEDVKKNVELIMQQIPEFFAHFGYDLGVPFPVEGSYGANMSEA